MILACLLEIILHMHDTMISRFLLEMTIAITSLKMGRIRFLYLNHITPQSHGKISPLHSSTHFLYTHQKRYSAKVPWFCFGPSFFQNFQLIFIFGTPVMTYSSEPKSEHSINAIFTSCLFTSCKNNCLLLISVLY